jgi:large subunit ribosomal protein L25
MILNLVAQRRTLGKKSDRTKLRNEGLIPAVIYGRGNVGQNVVISEVDFGKILKHTTEEVVMIDIEVDGVKTRTIIKAKQIHPVTRKYLHVDFLELHDDKPIVVNVPIHYVGSPAGTKQGGRYEVLVRLVEIVALPGNVPATLSVNVDHMEAGTKLRLSEIAIPNVEIKTNPNTVLALVHQPRAKV